MVYSQVCENYFFSFFLQTDFSKPNQCQSFKIIHPYPDVILHHHEIPFLHSSLLSLLCSFFKSALDKYRHVFCMIYKKPQNSLGKTHFISCLQVNQYLFYLKFAYSFIFGYLIHKNKLQIM